MKNEAKFVAVIFLCLCLSSVYAEEESFINAQWKVYQATMHYRSEFSFYNCEAMESKLRKLLVLLGARYDVRVETECLNNMVRGRISPLGQRFHFVRLAFALPVPADEEDLSREVFPARWQDTRISGTQARYLNGGDCELVRTFIDQVLPFLKVRNKSGAMECFAVQRTASRLRSKIHALIPVNEEDRQVIR